MQLAVIGYRNHAAKLIKLVNKFKEVKKIFVYHPDKNKIDNLVFSSKKIFSTSDLSKLDNVDGIIISSKNNSHANYLNIFSKKKNIFFVKNHQPIIRKIYLK